MEVLCACECVRACVRVCVNPRIEIQRGEGEEGEEEEEEEEAEEEEEEEEEEERRDRCVPCWKTQAVRDRSALRAPFVDLMDVWSVDVMPIYIIDRKFPDTSGKSLRHPERFL